MDVSLINLINPMITKEEIEQTRSPRGSRQFVGRKKEEVRKQRNERHKAIQKSGLYKVFTDEIIPLSLAASILYPNTYTVTPIIGNQRYDAIIRDNRGNIVDYVEITWPQDGKRKADDALNIVRRGYDDTDVYSPGEDVDRLLSFILKTCQKKAQKDYSDCTLVVVIDFVKPFPQHCCLYPQKLSQVVTQIKFVKI